MFFGKGISIGRIGGIAILLDYSWFIIFGLFVFLLATGYFPRVAPATPVSWHWGAAVLTSVLFFASVLGHELSHAFVARRHGIPINSITLFIFGGMAQMEDEPHTPWDEFSMAIAGPLASVAFGVVFFVLARLANGSVLWFVTFFYLGLINIILAVFNLLPGFPMDGGRVFRALVWRITGNMRKATLVASVTGQAFGWAFIGLGVGSVFFPALRAFGSLWLALVGWFLINAARSSYQQLEMRETLTQVHVSDLMSPQLETVPAGISLEHLVSDFLLREGASVFSVEQDGRMVGMVGVEDVRKVPREEWGMRIVSEVMRPLNEEAKVLPNDDGWDAANRMAQANSDRLLVEEADGRIDGIVTRGAIARWLQTHAGPNLAPGEA